MRTENIRYHLPPEVNITDNRYATTVPTVPTAYITSLTCVSQITQGPSAGCPSWFCLLLIISMLFD